MKQTRKTNSAAQKRQTEKKGGRTPAPASGLAELRRRAESSLQKQQERLDELTRQDMEQLIHELGTHQIELEMQNEELRKAQEDLEISHRRYADLYDYAPVGYFTFNANGIIIAVNLTGAAMIGRARNVLVDKPFNLFVHPEDRDLLYLCFRDTVKDAGKHFCDLRLKLDDSPVIHVHLETMAFQDEQYGTAIRATLSDITNFAKKEMELQERTSLLRTIIDNTDVMLAYLDRKFNFIWVNPAYAETCGMWPQEMVGINHFKFYPDPENEAIFKQVRDTGAPVFFKDKPFIFPDQPERGVTYWDWSLVPVKQTDGLVKTLVFSLRETTSYKENELALAESEERFRNMAQTSTDIIFQTDGSGIITYASPAVGSLGYRPDEVTGRFFTVFVAGEDLPRAETAFKQVSSGRRINFFDLRLIRADGALEEFEVNANPMVRKGVVTGMQGIARNITRRKEAEAKIRNLARFPSENPSPVMRVDSDGVILYANDASSSLLEFWGIAVGEAIPPEIRRWTIDALSTKTSKQVVLQCRDRVLSLNLAPIADDDFVNVYGNDITELKQAEERVRHRNVILNGINSIFLAGMKCSTDEELGAETLRIVEQITGSRSGFIGQVGADNLLHDLAISNPGWGQCAMADQTGHRNPRGNYRITGLYGRVLSSGESLLTNNPADHPTSTGTPPGHPPLTAFLGVPLINDNRVIGLIALANREGGYRQEDVESLEALAPAFVETLFRCRIERALRESEIRERNKTTQLKQLLDFAPIPIWIAHDPQCCNITGNLAAAELQGVGPDINVSQTPEPGRETPRVRHFQNGTELPPEDLPLQHAIRHGTRIDNIEIDLVMPNGRTLLMLGAATPLYDHAGHVTGGIAAYMDITDRKLLLARLQKAKQDWERTFDSVPDLIAVLDKDHTIQRVNRAMAERLGRSPKQIIGRKCYACFCGLTEPPDTCPHTLTLLDGKEHWKEFEEEVLDGFFLVTTTPLHNEQGNLTGSIYMARDISDQKKNEQKINDLNRELLSSLAQLEVANANLLRSNADLLHFSSIVSHDLQEPLRTVTSFVQLLSRRYAAELDDKAQAFMEHIVSGTNHMQRLLNDLLDFSRISGGELMRRPVAMADVLRDVRRKLNRSIKENRAQISMDPLPVVSGDEMQLFTLMQNLISNAIKYRGEAPPRIHVSVEQRGDAWFFCVRDNGIGIDPKHAERIFLIFQRLHLRTAYEGTGIGLAICKKIVERHEGLIWVESAPGQGASFYFTLPLTEP